MADRFEAGGGQVRLGCHVDEVVVRGGRAVAVRAGGEEIAVSRAVVADVSAPALYGSLLPRDALPAGLVRRMERFEWDPGTVKVDWALDGPVPWTGAPERAPGTVHVADSVDELALTLAQIASGTVPRHPFLLVGQMATADPVRAPVGHESLWAYTHVPQRVRHDAGAAGDASGSGELTGRWDDAELDRMAHRIEERIERRAPGFRDRVVARRVLGPHQLEERDENLVGGALNGGTASLQQQLVLRPVPGLGRAETPVRGLYLGSASAHPGGGVHGACGANAARAALWHHRLETPVRTLRRSR
jgi:phytoene dehydrogenase-like protein